MQIINDCRLVVGDNMVDDSRLFGGLFLPQFLHKLDTGVVGSAVVGIAENVAFSLESVPEELLQAGTAGVIADLSVFGWGRLVEGG